MGDGGTAKVRWVSSGHASRTTTYEYTGGQLTSIRYPSAVSDDVAVTYNASPDFRVSGVTDASGAWSYAYSLVGSVQTTTAAGPLGQELVVEVDTAIGRATSVTNALDDEWSYQYDADLRVTRITQPEGDFVEYDYDTRSNIVGTTWNAKPGSGLDPITTTTQYPALPCVDLQLCNKPASTTDALGAVTDYEWEPHHLQTILAHADPPIAAAIRLAAVTGLRKNDLLALPWWAVKENAIVWQTGKSRGRKSVVLPITVAVRDVLDSLERGACPTVLATSEGEPWTPPGRGLDSGVQRARDSADAAARDHGGPDATAGLEGLRFHDLRGTAATNYILAGLPLDDVATILGWELKRVKEIARRYVTGEAIGLGMIARLQEARNKPPTVKPGVKPTSPRRGRKRSNPVRAVAGELGLEPRMTVPKTVVLPLHHSPAGPA